VESTLSGLGLFSLYLGGWVRRLDSIKFLRRQNLRMEDLDALFAAAWGSPKPGYERVFAHKLHPGSRHPAGEHLVGFANVAWDGDVHFFLLDTTVHPAWQGRGHRPPAGPGGDRGLPATRPSGFTSTPPRS